MIIRLFQSGRVLRLLMVAVLALTACVGVHAQDSDKVDSLRDELAKASTPADSLVILHNIYDCSRFDRVPILDMIFHTAERAGDYRSMLEVVFVLTSSYKNEPEREAEMIEMVDRVPESEAQKLQKLYVRLCFQLANIQRMSEDERQQELLQTLKNYREHPGLDVFDRIRYLFIICTNLRNTTDAGLLTSYLHELQLIIEDFPTDELPIRSIFYALSSPTYLNNNMFAQALEANRHMLDIVGEFDKFHESQGRIYRNYDGSLYDCYHNMLMCYEILSDEEIDRYYNNILEIVSRSLRIRTNIDMQRRSRIFYLMGKRRYSEALPLIREQLDNGRGLHRYHLYADAYVKAAEAVGDKEALLHGLQIINTLLRERLDVKSDVSLGELQTIYDVDNLKTRNKDLTAEIQRAEIKNRHQSVIASIVAILVVVCLLVWMISLAVHSRWLAKHLFTANQKLVEERNALKETYTKLLAVRDKAKAADRVKNDFVENMSNEISIPFRAIVEYSHLIADLAEEDERPYIREYGEIMSVNTDLIVRLVNDLLELPEIESGSLSVHRSPSSVLSICNIALDLVKKHVAPGVKIIFANAGKPDSKIITDPQRVEQVLIQLLSNAAKFTETGSITLAYEINPAKDKITFTVTDTGIGVPRGMEEAIFDRFVKTDPTTQGNGLGLYISRMIADLMNGSLRLDATYRKGARFIFTAPINGINS